MMRPPSDEDIQELLDDRLDLERRGEVEAFLGRNPERAGEIEALRRQDNDLRRLNEAVLAEPIPERLLATVRSAMAPAAGGRSSADGFSRLAKPRARRWPAMAAAASIAFVIGTTAGWLGKDTLFQPPDRTIEFLVDDFYAAYTYATAESGFAWDFVPDDVDRFAEWSTQSFGTSVTPVDLSEAGYEFIGARVLPGRSRLAGLLHYRAKEEGYVAIYVWTDSGRSAPVSISLDHQGVHMLLRSGDRIGIAIASPSSQPRMEEVANKIFQYYEAVL